MCQKKGSKILKLPSVCNCFTLAVTNKLVFVINSLKVIKIKKNLLYELKFLVPNYSRVQNPWLGGYRPPIPVLSVLCPQLNLLNPPPEQNSWVYHWAWGWDLKDIPKRRISPIILRRVISSKFIFRITLIFNVEKATMAERLFIQDKNHTSVRNK